jgi:hypothetical protein
MFTKKAPTEKTDLQIAIDRLYTRLNGLSPETKEYAACADQLVKLTKLQADTVKPKVSYDALVSAGSSLAGILLILSHERAHVITTKALGFVTKALR